MFIYDGFYCIVSYSILFCSALFYSILIYFVRIFYSLPLSSVLFDSSLFPMLRFIVFSSGIKLSFFSVTWVCNCSLADCFMHRTGPRRYLKKYVLCISPSCELKYWTRIVFRRSDTRTIRLGEKVREMISLLLLLYLPLSSAS
jgi:hypothetical protein